MNALLRRSLFAVALPALALAPADDVAAQLRVLQTNSLGGSVHVIDPATQRVVGEIEGIPVNHGVAVSRDGSRIYVSSEAEAAVMVVDGRTMEVIETIPVSARPHNISLTPDGRKLYVAIIARPGAVNVIDTQRMEVINEIPHPGGLHNIYVTPDGTHVIAGSISGDRLTAYSTATDEEVWAWEGESIRPMAMSTKPDGSTDKVYIQVTGHHGFVVFDWDTRREVARITQPEIPEEDRYQSEPSSLGLYNGAPAHGIGVAPDGRTVWSTSRMNSHVYVYSVHPDLELLASVPVGTDPDWITFTPDGRYAYVANAHSNSVTAIDVSTYQPVATIPVGEGPKRNTVMRLPR